MEIGVNKIVKNKKSRQTKVVAAAERAKHKYHSYLITTIK